MRALALIAAAAAAGTPAPAPGLYCSISGERMPISIGADGGIGIDGLDCARAVYSPGRVRSDACYANGGAVVTLDVALGQTAAGELVFDMEIYRLRGAGPPCP
ncbi:hypothetical protein AO398_00060 [Methylobacterium sp. GXS13]|uniref:hypothetical protein n=1 Tax=Methylobacterium sp. GXS13 TaxID=1730094 RepID=UPI00071B0E58|nr:hypothetical protein [Methylobacterium sp. GXS13]KST61120.1 hypothetical protein AO398_00060 [Methylobacterium sp. GXS13]